jgi:hypothetical protein
MWGTIFDSENESLVSSLLIVIMFMMGAGKFVNSNSKSPLIKFFMMISPMKQGTEAFFRVVLSGHEDQERFLTNYFGMKDGVAYCEKKLIMFSVAFLIIGWIHMIYKARRS